MLASFPASRSILLVILLALGACTKAPSSDELLERAWQALGEGKLNAAVIDAKSALQQGTSNASGRRLLGEVSLKQRNLEEAALEFDKSLASVKDPAVGALYAQALFGSGQQDKLLELQQSDFFAFAGDEPAYWAFVARAHARTGDTFTAQAILEQVLDIDKNNPQVQLAQAAILVRHTGEFDKALTMLQELTQAHPEFENAWSLYGSVAQAMGDLAMAENAYAEAGRLNRYRLEDRLALVAVLVEQEKYDSATEELSRLQEVIPNHPSVNYAQARISLAGGNTKVTLEELAEVLNVSPNHMPSVYLAANASYRAGNLVVAESYIAKFLKSSPRNINGRQMLAAIYLEQGRAVESSKITRKLQKESPMSSTTLNLLAMALAAQGLHAESAVVYQDLTDISPKDASVRVGLGTELFSAGEVARGIEELEIAKTLDPTSGEVRSRLVRAYSAQGDTLKVTRELEEFRQMAPDDSRPSELAAQLALREGDKEKAKDHYTQAIELDPANSAARKGLAAVAMQEGDSSVALDILNEGLQAQPGDLETLLNLAAVYRERGDMDAMASTLQRAVDANPKALEPRLILARYNFEQGRAADSVTLLAEVRDENDGDPRVHQLLVGAYLAIDQPSAAVNSSESLLQLLPDNFKALRLAAQAERANGDLKTAERHLSKSVELQPDNVDSRMQLIEVFLLQNKLEETAAQLALLPEGAVPDERLNMAKGRIAQRLGKLAEAETLFRRAYASKPETISLLFLSGALWQQDKAIEATGVMASWLGKNPRDRVILEQLGTYYVVLGRDSDAVKVYETLVDMEPEDAVALNNLAWSYRKIDSNQALTYVRKALEIVPGSGAIFDSLSMILFEKGTYNDALVANQKALDVSRENPQYLFHRAQILETSGDSEGALVLLEKLVTTDVNFAGKADAVIMLARLKGA